jgi:hypothetical protein
MAAIAFLESEPDFNFPPEAAQTFSGNERIAGVMAFSGKHNAFPGSPEKFGHCLCDSGASLVHQCFDIYPPRESRFLCGPHLRRSQNREIQLSLLIF